MCEWYCGCFTNGIGLIFHIPPVPFNVCVLEGKDIGAYSVYYSAVEERTGWREREGEGEDERESDLQLKHSINVTRFWSL